MRRRNGNRANDPRHAYRAVASDGDGTLTDRKRMNPETLAALERLRAAGCTLILTTGERPEDLADFPHTDRFDAVVAENGALLYRPATGEEKCLAGPPPDELLRELRRRGVEPLSAGRAIVCTRRPQDRTVAAVIRELGLDWDLAFNRDQVMAVPAGVDKATGLAVALEELGLAPAEVVGIGDAENDVPLLGFCGCGVAVASAVAGLKARADLVTEGGPGAGFVEMAERLLAGTLPAPRRVPGP